MAKRFTDTALSRKAWFRKLPPRLKCAWRFLTDECDMVGIWSIDMEALSFHVGEEISLEEMLSYFTADKESRVVRFGSDKLFLPGFIEFQYGKLSEECKPHRPVIARLVKLNLLKGYQKGFETLEDKEKDKDKEKEKERGGVGEIPPAFDFASLYAKYPRKEGKAKGLAACKAQIRSQDDFGSLSRAIDRYAEHLAKTGTEPKFYKHFSSFMHSWRDWLDPETGTVEKPKIEEPDWVKQARAEEARSKNAV